MSAQDCSVPALRSRPSTIGGTGIRFIHGTIPAGSTTALADLPFDLIMPSRFFMLVSVTVGASADSNRVFIHEKPTNKSYLATAVAAKGTEEWFSMKSYIYSGTENAAQLIEFPDPIARVYITVGNEAGAGATPWSFTIAYSDRRFGVTSQFNMF